MTIRDEQCGEKRKYATLQAARRDLKYMRSTEGLRPYLCQFCRHYHIGNGVRHEPQDHQHYKRWRYNPNEDYDQ